MKTYDYPGRSQLDAAVRPILLPLITPALKAWAGHRVTRLLGFWMLWHTYGGLDGIVETGIMPSSTAYKQRKEFRETFGVKVEDWDPELAAVIAGRRKTLKTVTP